MAKSTPGGPSTIRGILYQILYSLSIFGELYIHAPLASKAKFDDATIVLEPSDGGDHQIIKNGSRKVEQLKIRTDGEGTWSLKEVIESVIPDLYRAVDFEKIETEFVLVTEGRRGRWSEVEDFFNDISKVEDAQQIDGLIDALDGENELKFQRIRKQDGFWGDEAYTKMSLFNRIAKHLESVDDIKKSGDDPEAIRRKLFYLISRTKFAWETLFARVENTVQAWVSELIDAPEEIENCINSLIGELQNLSTVGDKPINAKTLLDTHGLNCIALGDFGRIRQKAESLQEQMLSMYRIRAEEDPRTKFAKSLFDSVYPGKPHQMLVGESGQGKSWLGFSIINEALRQQHLAFVVSSRGTGHGNVAAVGEQFWQRIVGHGNPVPYANTVAKLASRVKGLSSRRIFVFLEGSLNIDELRETCLEPWETWNTTLILNCFPKTFANVDEVIGNRFNRVDVPDFTHEETKNYLNESAPLYDKLDSPVQQTIRRPFFAAIFRELATTQDWGQEIEYQLYDQYWIKLMASAEAHDVEDLKCVSLKVFNGECGYPFSFAELCSTNDQLTPERLVLSRWIRKTLDARFEFWHRRLLDWVVAIAAIERLKANELDEQEFANRLGEIYLGLRKEFGFVPMDVLWMALQNDMNGFALKLQLAMEGRK